MTPATRWHKLFERDDYHSELVEHVIEEQAAFERRHPVPYAPDQRLVALVQRAERAHGGSLPKPVLTMLTKAVSDWAPAVKAAEEVP